tara:strand:- start:317 stop:565 length:249 start_codon:yes stop_codon:yes gene_type:complete
MKVTAYRYYDDSPNYGSALIYATDPEAAKEAATDYHEDMLDGLIGSGDIFSTCRIVEVLTERQFSASLRDSDEVINADEEGY